MLVNADGLNCRQCFSNKERMPHFQPPCTYGRCRTASVQYEGVEAFVNFWSMLRQSESLPADIIISGLELSDEDKEILVCLDAYAAKLLDEKREQERQKQKALSNRGSIY